MQRIGTSDTLPLHGVGATRSVEAALTSRLPPFEPMARAGACVAQLARALAPHARRIWIACGPGNNGGDGLVAARRLREQSAPNGLDLVVTLCGDPARLPPDAARALSEAMAAGVRLADEPPETFDLGIDALLGIGARDAPQGQLAQHLIHLHAQRHPLLAVDVPSGLLADSGHYTGPGARSAALRHTLSLLTLKPGLFTADGRDIAGTVWFDPLEPPEGLACPPDAYLLGGDVLPVCARPHASHKGSQGDVVVIGGQGMGMQAAGMTGAAVLAARAALHAGAGRVYIGLLEPEVSDRTVWDPGCPELMFRGVAPLVHNRQLMEAAAVACGCGGGTAVAEWLPLILSSSGSLVLDADGLNRTAEDSSLRALLRARGARGQTTVITPHPLEAARLLACPVSEVMTDRLAAAKTLSEDLDAICVLKGSGTVVAAPRETSRINSSGNPALATAGTGDVLAGRIAAALAAAETTSSTPLRAVLGSVFSHGRDADLWVERSSQTLTASRLTLSAAST